MSAGTVPVPATWLPDGLPDLNRRIVQLAHRYVGIEELSRNSSGLIDGWNRRAGAPPRSPWCASFATAIYEDCGAAVPPQARASCDVLMEWAKREGLWVPAGRPAPEGSMVLYGVPGDAQHVGILVRVLPGGRRRAVEGNTSWSGFSREGTAVVMKPVNEGRVLGHLLPRAA